MSEQMYVYSDIQSCSILCDPMNCSLTRLLCPWDFPGEKTEVGCHILLHGLFPTHGLNPCLLYIFHGYVNSLSLRHLGNLSELTQFCPTLWDPMDCRTPGLPVHHKLLDFTQLMSIESVIPSNHLILCHPLLLPPSVFPRIRVFSNESALLIRWPKYWSFSFSIIPSNGHLGLISFKVDWFDFLVAQRTLKSLLQHHSSNTSVLSLSAFFMILMEKFRCIVKKVGKMTTPFRYDLNHIPYDYTVKVTNRFKGLDLTECLK